MSVHCLRASGSIPGALSISIAYGADMGRIWGGYGADMGRVWSGCRVGGDRRGADNSIGSAGIIGHISIIHPGRFFIFCRIISGSYTISAITGENTRGIVMESGRKN